jgi:hypothetical protein
MMNTAMLIASGTEDSGTHFTITDRDEREDTTFADSFGERFGLSDSTGAKKFSDTNVSEIRQTQVADLSNNSDDTSVASGAKATPGRWALALNEISNAAQTKKTASSRADSDREHSKVAVGKLSREDDRLQNTRVKTITATGVLPTRVVKDEQPAGEADEIVEDSSPTQIDLPIADLGKASFLSQGNVIGHNRIGNGIESPIQNEVTPLNGIESEVLAKKTSKTQASGQETKNASKVEKPVAIADGAETKTPVMTEVQGASSLHMQASALDGSKRDQAISTDIAMPPLGKPAIGVSIRTSEDVNHKQTPFVGKEKAGDSEIVANPTVDQTLPAKFSDDIAKAVAASTIKDGDEKTPGAITTTTLSHALVGNNESASGGTAEIISIHLPGAVAEMKIQLGGVNAHAANLQAGPGEDEGSNAVAAEVTIMHRTLLTSPSALEVGLPNGTQGWLKIRAEMTGGGLVNASLSSGTSAGQEMLRRELPALTAYLQQERVVVNDVTVHASVASAPESQLAGGTNREGSRQAHQNEGQDGEEAAQRTINTVSGRAENVMAHTSLNVVGEDGLSLPMTSLGGGGWLSVRA